MSEMATEKRRDLIDRKDLIAAEQKKNFAIADNTHPYEEIRIQGKYFWEIVESAPTVDAVEVSEYDAIVDKLECLLCHASVGKQHFGRCQCGRDHIPQAFLDVPLLIAYGEDLVQLPDDPADLLSSFCFVPGVPYFCDPLSTLLLGSAVGFLLLPFQDIHQRFGCLQSEQPLIVDIQPVLGFLSLFTKRGQPLLIPGATGKGEFTNFLSQLPKFLFLSFFFFDVLAVLLDLTPLDVIL